MNTFHLVRCQTNSINVTRVMKWTYEDTLGSKYVVKSDEMAAHGNMYEAMIPPKLSTAAAVGPATGAACFLRSEPPHPTVMMIAMVAGMKAYVS